MAGRQPDWEFTPKRRKSLRHAQIEHAELVKLGKEYRERLGKRKK